MPVVVAFDGQYGNLGFLQRQQRLGGLAQHGRCDLRGVEKVAGDQEGVRAPFDRTRDDARERVGEIGIGQPAVQTAASEMDVRTMDEAHGIAPSPLYRIGVIGVSCKPISGED